MNLDNLGQGVSRTEMDEILGYYYERLGSKPEDAFALEVYSMFRRIVSEVEDYHNLERLAAQNIVNPKA